MCRRRARATGRAPLLGTLTLSLVVLGACVTTFDGVFTNPCAEPLDIAAYYGDSDDYRGGERHLIIEANLEPLEATRIPQAFEDPEAEPFTVVVEGRGPLIDVDGSNRRDASAGEIMVVIPAEACEG